MLCSRRNFEFWRSKCVKYLIYKIVRIIIYAICEYAMVFISPRSQSCMAILGKILYYIIVAGFSLYDVSRVSSRFNDNSIIFGRLSTRIYFV